MPNRKTKNCRPNGKRTAKPRRKARRFSRGIPKGFRTQPYFRRAEFLEYGHLRGL